MEYVPRNVFRVCPDAPQTVAPSPVKKYNVIGVSAEVLRVCENQVTIDDLKKAAKCARFDFFRAYTVSDILLSETDFPAKRNIYIKRAIKPAVGSRTKIFSVCEATSTLPRRTTPVVAPSPQKNTGKKKLLRTAINALKTAISSLEELHNQF